MTKLSININKFATLRNARGGNNPDIIKTALDCERFGAEGITVHPRPDERHIRYQDVLDLKAIVTTEFNIEGNPDKRYIDLVLLVCPTQATLVPDAPTALTSDTGWDTITHADFLKETIQTLKQKGIRTSIFINPIPAMIEGAARVGADRIEFYTGAYAHRYSQNPAEVIRDYVTCAQLAHSLGLGINAGHDLSLENLRYFCQQIPQVAEVSIGHALICDALYYGLENTIQLYKRELISK
jgi:pyridoxine 5-phosphate synthase